MCLDIESSMNVRINIISINIDNARFTFLGERYFSLKFKNHDALSEMCA